MDDQVDDPQPATPGPESPDSVAPQSPAFRFLGFLALAVSLSVAGVLVARAQKRANPVPAEEPMTAPQDAGVAAPGTLPLAEDGTASDPLPHPAGATPELTLNEPSSPTFFYSSKMLSTDDLLKVNSQGRNSLEEPSKTLEPPAAKDATFLYSSKSVPLQIYKDGSN